MSNVLVMMSTYNGEKYVEQQIRSIMGQKTCHNVFLRIRDDGSSDKTCEIIETIAKEYHGRVEIIMGQNIGSNASFFSLIADADGYDYYSISDQDDVWLDNKIQIACDTLAKENTQIPLLFSCSSYMVKNDLIPFGETRKKEREFSLYNTIIQNICPGHNQVFNNALLNILKKVQTPNRIYVYDMWIANIAILYGKILFSNSSLTYYRQHEGNLMGTQASRIGKLLLSYRRLISGDGIKTREQIKYFIEMNEEELIRQNLYDEIYRFLNCRTFVRRLRYIATCKLYRQTALETLAFKLAVISGKY